MRPLADEIRPQTLDEVAGQKHLLGEGALLRRLIENGAEANLIFYGPSGTGKTTIANIIAKRTQKALYHLNATTASLSDIKAIIADVDTMLAPNGILIQLRTYMTDPQRSYQKKNFYSQDQQHCLFQKHAYNTDCYY